MISFNVITRDDPAGLEKALTSLYEVLYEEGDEAVIVDTGSTPEVLEKIRALVNDFQAARLIERPDLTIDVSEKVADWVPEASELITRPIMKSFAAAREVARKASKNPIIFWIDTDDELIEKQPGALRRLIGEMMDPDKPQIGAIFLDYLYAFAEDGQCTTVLKRERAVLRDRYYWAGRCHETLLPNADELHLNSGYFEGLCTQVRHNKFNNEDKLLRESDARNYLILRTEMEEDAAAGKEGDPRTKFYLGNAARGLRRWFESLKLYADFLDESGSRDDRYASAYYMGGIYMTQDLCRPFDAIKWYTRANEISPQDPRGFYGLARCYAALHRFAESMLWYEHAERLPEPAGLHSYDPTHVLFHPHLVAARACKELGMMVKAVEYAQKACDYREKDKDAAEVLQCMKNAASGRRLAEAITTICSNLPHKGPNAARVAREICNEMQAIPPEIEKVGISKTEPPDPRPPAPTLAIWCGQTGEPWGPRSRKDGVGGSEKMVLLISEALQKRGVNVSVYCTMDYGSRGIDPKTGVNWRHWAEFDEKQPRDVLVLWRQVTAVAGLASPAKKRVLWLHDVQNPAAYTDVVKKVVNLVQCQSEFHAEPLRDILPPEKIWIARNAIEAPLLDWSQKNPKSVIYLSSPDRGLLTSARIVEEAQKLDPKITLTVLYGVTPWARQNFAKSSYMSIPDIGRDWCLDDYELAVHAQLDKIGAVNLGRIGFDAVSRCLAKSGVWIYPTRFPEISCMSAMEAMAHGAIPVCTRYGALAETVSSPTFALPPATNEKSYYKAAGKILYNATRIGPNEVQRKILSTQSYEAFNIDDLADEWIQRLGLEGETAAPSPTPSLNATLEGAACPTT